MTSPYGHSGGDDPQQSWGQQPSYGPEQGSTSGAPPAQPYPQQGQHGQQHEQYPQHTQAQQQPAEQPVPQQPVPPQPAQQPGYGQQPVYQQPAPPQQPMPQQPVPGQYPQQAAPQTGQHYAVGYPQQQEQVQQPYPGYAATPAAAEQPEYVGEPQDRRRGGLVWALVVVVVVIAAVIAILGFVWPGWFTHKIFDDSVMQGGVQQILHDNYKLNVTGVTCAGTHDVTVGSQFTCTAVIDKKPTQVQITVKTSDGLYEVANPTQ